MRWSTVCLQESKVFEQLLTFHISHISFQVKYFNENTCISHLLIGRYNVCICVYVEFRCLRLISACVFRSLSRPTEPVPGSWWQILTATPSGTWKAAVMWRSNPTWWFAHPAQPSTSSSIEPNVAVFLLTWTECFYYFVSSDSVTHTTGYALCVCLSKSK